jgi:hypothetical protein
MKTARVVVNLEPDEAAALKAHALETGCPQTELIRRAIRLALFADKQVSRKSAQRTPVLFAPNRGVETR